MKLGTILSFAAILNIAYTDVANRPNSVILWIDDLAILKGIRLKAMLFDVN